MFWNWTGMGTGNIGLLICAVPPQADSVHPFLDTLLRNGRSKLRIVLLGLYALPQLDIFFADVWIDLFCERCVKVQNSNEFLNIAEVF